jgi:hypothetical protein
MNFSKVVDDSSLQKISYLLILAKQLLRILSIKFLFSHAPTI